MLKILRKHSQHWLIAAVIGAIVVVFIFWGMGSMDPHQSQEIARVYDKPIPLTTYYQYANLLEKKNRFRRNLSEDDVKAMRESAPDNLINLVLVNDERQIASVPKNRSAQQDPILAIGGDKANRPIP